MTSEQRCLIGCSSSPVTRRSSRLMPAVGSSSSKQLRLRCQSHRDLQPLLLAVRQDSGRVLGAVGQTELIEHQQNLLVQRRTAAREDERAQRVLSLQRQQDVVVDGERRKHAGDLELEAQPGAGALG